MCYYMKKHFTANVTNKYIVKEIYIICVSLKLLNTECGESLSQERNQLADKHRLFDGEYSVK